MPHIVLIEDNPADVLLVKLALEENQISHELTCFENGTDAVNQLCGSTNGGDFVPDAILLDLNTPRTDGFAALAVLRKHFAYVPITILTSSRARADKRRASAYEAEYMEKPSDLQTFIDSIGNAVKRMLLGNPSLDNHGSDRNKTYF